MTYKEHRPDITSIVDNTALNNLENRVTALETSVTPPTQALPGQLQFAVATATIVEGNSRVVTVNRVNGSDGEVTCNFNITTSLTITTHYTTTVASGGTLTFAAGELQKTVTIASVADSITGDGAMTFTLDTFTSAGSADAAIAGIRSSTALAITNTGAAGAGNAVSGNELFFDDFNYAVGYSDVYVEGQDPFVLTGGWDFTRSSQTHTLARSRGTLYTTTTIDSYSGQMPGVSGSGRVLALHNRTGTELRQGDVYLGMGGAAQNAIPGDVWFQHWIYPQNAGAETGTLGTDSDDGGSNSGAMKWFYMSRNGYPSSDYQFLSNMNNKNKLPYFIEHDPTRNDLYFHVQANAVQVPDTIFWKNRADIGHNTNAGVEPAIPQNVWSLLRFHFRTLATGTNSIEVWMRPLGSPSFIKIVELIDGATLDGDVVSLAPFVSGTTAGFYGHDVMQWMTSIGRDTGQNNSGNRDSWMYFSDFAMAAGVDAPTPGNGAADLPTYTDY